MPVIRIPFPLFYILTLTLTLTSILVNAYTVDISSLDDASQICSGMWAGGNRGGSERASIQVSFDQASIGQIALVIYEWSDVDYLGARSPSLSTEETAYDEEYLPKTYICTSSAFRSGLCNQTELGQFIVTIPPPSSSVFGKQITRNMTSIYTTGLRFRDGTTDTDANQSTELHRRDEDDEEEDIEPETTSSSSSSSKTRHKHIKTKTHTKTKTSSASSASATESITFPPIRHGKGSAATRTHSPLLPTATATIGSSSSSTSLKLANLSNTDDAGTPWYDGGVILYNVKKTGYYCIGTVPVTLVSTGMETRDLIDPLPVVSSLAKRAEHASYKGKVVFQNVFKGELPAAEWPKIDFYSFMTLVYLLAAVGWGVLCWKYRSELLPIQTYVSGTLVYVFVEMFIFSVYYRYLNKHGLGAGSTAFLLVVAILNAGRNSLSFFLLLVVSMGLSVVTPTLGSSVMNRVRILSILHFVFGVVYSVGIVEVSLESASLLLILSLIAGLSLTLTTFLMWTAVSLAGTILHLEKRKQQYKLQMFKRLYRILMAAVLAIAGFFVISTISLSARTSEDYTPNNWQYRWFLLEGSLSLIYFFVFASIAYLWRPTGRNQQLSMSEELAQDEDEADAAEDFELGQRGGLGDEDDDLEAARGMGGRPDHPDDDEEGEDAVAEAKRQKRAGKARANEVEGNDDRVVFAIDDEESEDEEKKVGEGHAVGGRKVSGEETRRSLGDGEEGDRLLSKRD